MKLKDMAMHAAVLKALETLVKESDRALRPAMFDALKSRYAEDGTRTLDVNLPDGTKVARVSLSTGPSGVRVSDPVAFTAWVKAHHPEAIVQPPPPPPCVREAWQEEFLANSEVRGDEVFDPATGEQVPGLDVVPAGPKTFSVTVTDRAAMLSAWRAGELAMDTALMLGGGDD